MLILTDERIKGDRYRQRSEGYYARDRAYEKESTTGIHSSSSIVDKAAVHRHVDTAGLMCGLSG